MITSKAKLEQKCREILHGTPLFEFVNEEWSKFLIEEVFPNHPDWEAKVGIGIDHLEVRPDKFRGRCFYIIRRNGSFTDISFKAAIYPPNKKADVKSACRSAIQPMIARIRSAIRVPFKCPITGEDVIDKRDAHIDHYDLTFNEVFNEWIKGKDIDALYERTRRSNKDNDTFTYFDDEDICKDFLEFHNQHTHLRVVSKTANLSALKKTKSL